MAARKKPNKAPAPHQRRASYYVFCTAAAFAGLIGLQIAVGQTGGKHSVARSIDRAEHAKLLLFPAGLAGIAYVVRGFEQRRGR